MSLFLYNSIQFAVKNHVPTKENRMMLNLKEVQNQNPNFLKLVLIVGKFLNVQHNWKCISGIKIIYI